MTEHNERLSIKTEADDWLDAARAEWMELLGDSDANTLFLGWDWQQAWWRHFGSLLRGRLKIVTARDSNARLVGLAPLFTRRSAARRLWPIRQLAPIGNVWRINLGEVTEHMDWIVRRGWEQTVPAALAAQLFEDEDWDEFLLAYTPPDSFCRVQMQDHAYRSSCYVRAEVPLRHYSVDTGRSFADFIAELGEGARRRVFGRRGRLGRLGSVAVVTACKGNLERQLDKLEQLSQLRWGMGLTPQLRSFYREISERFLRQNTLRFTTLEVDGRPISALFDVDARGTTFNIRSAIDTDFDNRISPGLLHLGYAIEDACERAGTTRYALLAGQGKQTDFKRNLASIMETFESIQLIRKPHERLLYRLYDGLRGAARDGRTRDRKPAI